MPQILLLDNFDSFTYNLQDFLERLGAKCSVFRNNIDLHHITKQKYEGVVLSPGPATPRKAGNLMSVLGFYYQRLPILGVCLGHQAIGEFFGATLTQAHQPMHGKISEIITQEGILFANLPSKFKVVRYHSLVLQNIPKTLKITAITNDSYQEVMALEHRYLPIFGVQFHPEAILCEYGLEILRNWLNVL